MTSPHAVASRLQGRKRPQLSRRSQHVWRGDQRGFTPLLWYKLSSTGEITRPAERKSARLLFSAASRFARDKPPAQMRTTFAARQGPLIWNPYPSRTGRTIYPSIYLFIYLSICRYLLGAHIYAYVHTQASGLYFTLHEAKEGGDTCSLEAHASNLGGSSDCSCYGLVESLLGLTCRAAIGK